MTPDMPLFVDAIQLQPRLNWNVALFCICLAVIANVGADLFLLADHHLSYRSLPAKAKRLRLARWVLCVAGLLVAGLVNHSPFVLINLALFTITAATDLETKRIPPDWFTYGCVVLACAFGYVTGGVPGLRDVVAAQAICFAIMVTAVLFARAASGGDVKVLMQYGASCGSLPYVIIGIFVETAVRVVVVALGLGRAIVLGGDRRTEVRNVLRMQLPHAPVAWVGVMSAVIVAGLAGGQ